MLQTNNITQVQNWHLAKKLLEQWGKKIDLSQYSVFLDPCTGGSPSTTFTHWHNTAHSYDNTYENKDDDDGSSYESDENDNGDDSNVDEDCNCEHVECGADFGVFGNALKELLEEPNIICFDKNASPHNSNIKKVDFLKMASTAIVKELSPYDPSEILITTNVPFGRRGKLAGRFLRKRCKIADHVACILPLSFLNKNGRLIEKYVDPLFHVKFKKRVDCAVFLDCNSKPTTTNNVDGDYTDVGDNGDGSDKSDRDSFCYCSSSKCSSCKHNSNGYDDDDEESSCGCNDSCDDSCDCSCDCDCDCHHDSCDSFDSCNNEK